MAFAGKSCRSCSSRARRATRSALVLLLVAHASESRAQPRVETNPDSVLAEALASIPGTALALEEAVRLALENSTEVREAEAALRAASAGVQREKGVFDPEFFAELQRTSDEVRATSPFLGTPVLSTDELGSTAGARIKLSTGTELEASLAARRQETNSSFEFLNPQYETEGTLALTQPLLKGLGPATRADLSAAERVLEAARSRYDNTVLAVRAVTEQLYWDLYAAGRDLAVERLIRDRAGSFLAETELRARSGLVGPNQVANAQVFLAEEEQAALDREEQLDVISDALATFLGRRPQAGPRFTPNSEPPRDYPLAPQDSLVLLALQNNHDLRVLQKRIESVAALEHGARWEALPALDLVGTLGGSGLAGTGREATFVFGGDTLRVEAEDTDLGDALSQLFEGDFPNWSLGLRFSLPLGLREDRGERDRLRAELAVAEEQLEAARRRLEANVRNQHRQLANARQRVGSARRGVDASQEQVRIGLLEYQAGRTTAFEIVRLGADLATAQQRYSQALVRAAKAAAELRLLTAGRFPPETPGRED
jgi:outer membrane protein TolC